MAAQSGTGKDPRQTGAKPPFDQEPQEYPGSEAEMRPQADHGEQSYRGTGKLQGKAALITGADSGIGRAVAVAYAREGADVLISYIDEEEDAAETARLVERQAGRRSGSEAISARSSTADSSSNVRCGSSAGWMCW